MKTDPQRMMGNVTIMKIVRHNPIGIRMSKNGRKKLEDTPEKQGRMYAGKRCLDTCVEFKAIVSYYNIVYGQLKSLRLMGVSFGGGMVPIPNERMDKVWELMEEVEMLVPKLVRNLEEVYDDYVQLEREIWQDDFDASNYPPKEELKSRFWIEFTPISIGPAPNPQRDEVTRFQAMLTNVAENAMYTLRKQYFDNLNNLLNAVNNNERKRFRSSALEYFTTFHEAMRADLNSVPDEELEALATKIKNILGAVDPQALSKGKKGDQIEAERVSVSLEPMFEELKAMMEDKPRRMISFED